MKKIGITCYPTIGGSGVIATELGKKLAEKGHEIHFITSSMPFRLEKVYVNVYYHQVEMSHYPVFQYPPYDLALAAKMAEVIDREKLDILHVHYAMPHAICGILARDMAKHPVKIVTTLHGTDITILGIDNTLKPIIRHGIEQSDAVTVVSESLRKQTVDMLDIQKEMDVIYNFINENEYYPQKGAELRSQFQINASDKIMIHISNFRKVKRVQDIIDTFKIVNESIPSKLLLIGDGPEYSDMVQHVNELGLKTEVHFLGKQNNVSDILAMADVMLLMSEKESFGLVLLEAMACGVAGIGTNVGGIPEVLTHDKTGYIVELGDIEQAASYAIELLSDPEKQHQFSEAAIEHVRNHFASAKIVNQYEALYDKVLEEGKRG
ncbi:glycosyl transferase [Oceanobacillus oncorhynchi subsp. incaldanensis]|uniref:D-inositol 3-phosphate glycosyltransferase n=2 Tax=Oceanobacillus TaxID=182709 RepID=A0A0A1MKV3_9BACI|nr:N-acetyl-alpha-D-glucosaminyl L-malate synthase BshA [Oceanobacillus oncorhynchi]MDM8101581.1 N-acetyl-alpha-D-glucosaminyl L-malate synthase BshA [Oceanobacillus oncorhynchi]UUI38076.1 N-acetyl-alpha-D-glucosaminyl L-malate synthase BshA [Oceanobacillus oncorhynchi]GIO17222.1 glycosyl transferase [Oceanobacillus oncorhynchi subsp. incaldanensis]CEI83728.1 D-inositol 3-phosphate glycosyltransferase [Oceanobacillus oncorhynchi]